MTSLSRHQEGMALLACLTFLLMLSVLGVSALQSAGQQQKIAGSVLFGHQSLQAAETALRKGESQVQAQWPRLIACASAVQCIPPQESRTQQSPGLDPVSRVIWERTPDGLFGIQSLGEGGMPANLPGITVGQFYRVTGIGLRGLSRTVLESVLVSYQQVGAEAGQPQGLVFRRVMWRQIQ